MKEGGPSLARSDRGIVLPVALLLVLALFALATSVFVLARTELLLERRDLAYLRERVQAEHSLAAGAEFAPEDVPLDLLPLGRGFLLSRPGASGARPSPAAVVWLLDPDSVAAGLPGAIEAGSPPPVEGVEPSDPACFPYGFQTLIRSRGPGPVPPAVPPLRDPPRLGILGAADLLPYADAILPLAGPLPARDTPGILQAPSEALLIGGEASGLLVAEGDLTLGGSAHFRGLLLVGGDLEIRDSATLEGVALVGGTARLLGDARILGCPEWARVALAHPFLARIHPVPGGALLGRF